MKEVIKIFTNELFENTEKCYLKLRLLRGLFFFLFFSFFFLKQKKRNNLRMKMLFSFISVFF